MEPGATVNDTPEYTTLPASNCQLPEFRAESLQDKTNDYCVAVFVIDEGDRLRNQLERMQPLKDSIDIVIADGGSTDGSTDLDYLKSMGVNTLLTKTGAGKLGAQMRMAFGWAVERGYKGVVVIDGNNKDGVDAIPNFVAHLEEGYDHVQGSRFIPGGHHENTPLSRLVGVKILHAPVIRIASGFKYTDTTNGFRGYSSKFLQDEKVALFRDVFGGYELHYYLAIRAARLGFKCIEIPVSRKYPDKGKTPTKISPLKGNLKVIWTLLRTAMGKYNP